MHISPKISHIGCASVLRAGPGTCWWASVSPRTPGPPELLGTSGGQASRRLGIQSCLCRIIWWCLCLICNAYVEYTVRGFSASRRLGARCEGLQMGHPVLSFLSFLLLMCDSVLSFPSLWGG